MFWTFTRSDRSDRNLLANSYLPSYCIWIISHPRAFGTVVARTLCMREVEGSNPSTSSTFFFLSGLPTPVPRRGRHLSPWREDYITVRIDDLLITKCGSDDCRVVQPSALNHRIKGTPGKRVCIVRPSRKKSETVRVKFFKRPDKTFWSDGSRYESYSTVVLIIKDNCLRSNMRRPRHTLGWNIFRTSCYCYSPPISPVSISTHVLTHEGYAECCR